MTNLIELAHTLDRNPSLLRYFDMSVEQQKWLKELTEDIHAISKEGKLPREVLIDLYKKGFTYMELAELTGRLKQSVYTSIASNLSEEDKKQHKERRKLWTLIQNYIDFAYEVDEAGTWEYLTLKYPDVSLQVLKQRYRNKGGTMLLNRKRKQEMLMVKRCIEVGMSAKQVSDTLDMPMSTVYLRIWSVLQEKYPNVPLEQIKEYYNEGKLSELPTE